VEIIKAYCNKCCDDRRQEVLHTEKTNWDEEVDHDFSIHGSDTYVMIKCCGCENVALRHTSWFSEHTDEHGRPIEEIIYYPPATFRKEPRWISELMWGNDFITDLLKEIYVSLRNDSSRLAVMGIRALLEQVMVDKVGDQGTFKQNLDKFESEGFVSKSQRTVLEPVLEAGHATIHRSFKPSKRDLVSLIDVAENIIESIYVNETRVAEIRTKVPTRQKPNTGKKP
jgi:hypothetical protein